MATLPQSTRMTGPLTTTAGQTLLDGTFRLIDAPGDTPGSCVIVRRERAGVVTELSLADAGPAPFTINSAGENSFVLALTTPAQAGDKYYLIGRQVQKRARSHPQGGMVRTPVLEGDAEELYARAQEAAAALDRSVKVPVGEDGLELPRAPARAGKVQAYDEDGKPDLSKGVEELAADAAALVTAPALAQIATREEQALEAVGEAQTTATEAIATDGAAALLAIGNAGDSELSQIGSAGDDELAGIAAAGDAQRLAVAGTSGADQYGSTAAALSKGVWSVTITAAGSGGTNGTYPWTTTGGTGTGAAGYLVIAGGAVTQVAVTSRGKGYTTGEALAITGTHGLSGHTLTLVTAQNETAGKLFQVVTTDGIDNYVVDAGGATATFVKPVADGDQVDDLRKNVAIYTGTGDIIPLELDMGNRLLRGFNRVTKKYVGLNAPGVLPEPLVYAPRVPLAEPIVTAAINQLLLYGQSLSVGALAGSLISTTQPYDNLTFAGGPRAWNGTTWDFGTFKPLVEDQVSPSPDGFSDRKETPCSGAANYATERLVVAGQATDDHVILASTAGRGGYRLDQLDKAAAWYANFLAHVSGAHAQNADHAVHAVPWIQGETDALAATTYATYRADLAQLQVDAETDIKGITGQTSPVYFLTYQCSYSVRAHPDIALAHLDLAQNNDRFFLTTPTYIFPHVVDAVHLNAIGYRWLGAYIGRAYSELVLGFEPQWLNPVSATVRGAEVRVRFDAPTLPLVLDDDNLAATTDYGFAVTDGGVDATISSIEVDGSEVVITLSATPSGVVVVRYALDYLGTGLNITNGGSGNLRDSTPDVTFIGGVSYPLWHVSPAFELTAVALGS